MSDVNIILATPIVLAPAIILVGLGLSFALDNDKFDKKLSKIGGWFVAIFGLYTVAYILVMSIIKICK